MNVDDIEARFVGLEARVSKLERVAPVVFTLETDGDEQTVFVTYPDAAAHLDSGQGAVLSSIFDALDAAGAPAWTRDTDDAGCDALGLWWKHRAPDRGDFTGHPPAPLLGDASKQAEYLSALDDLVAAAHEVERTFPVHGMGVEYPVSLPSFDDFVCELVAWRDAERASPLKWCTDCGALEGECDARCSRVDGRTNDAVETDEEYADRLAEDPDEIADRAAAYAIVDVDGGDGISFVTHTSDEQCELDADDQCTVCGVSHTAACEHCGGRGFHRAACRDAT